MVIIDQPQGKPVLFQCRKGTDDRDWFEIEESDKIKAIECGFEVRDLFVAIPAPVLHADILRLNWLLETNQIYALTQGYDTCIMASPVCKGCDVEGFWIDDVTTSDVRIAIDHALGLK